MRIATSALVLLVALAAPSARADDCSKLVSPLYVTGSSAVQPFLAEIGKILVTANPPVTLVYQGQGSCIGVAAVLDGAPVSGMLTYWDAVGTQQTCTLAATSPVVADIGVSDVFFDSCVDFANTALPGGVGDFSGPNQIMEFVVPAASSQLSISAQAAYLVFGFGDGVTQFWPTSPWSDHNFMYQRDSTSGTQSMISAAIGLRADRWLGRLGAKGSSDVFGGLIANNLNHDAAEKSIGILSADWVDPNRKSGPTTGLVTLAYQHTHQKCAYLPDSSATSFDKANVRDGHYPIWGPLHMYTKVDSGGVPVNPSVKAFTDYMTDKLDSPGPTDAEIDTYTVPQCAMKVKRNKEVGPYISYSPAKPCGCYFEKRVGGKPSCATCTDNTGCTPGQICSYGYCEGK